MTTETVTPEVTPTDTDQLDFTELGLFDSPPDSGNFTIYPNTLIDIAPLLEPVEFKTLVMIYRQLYGYGKRFFGYLAISRLAELTGQCRNTIKTALDALEAKKLIKVLHTIKNGVQQVYIFLLNKHTTTILNDIEEGRTTIEKITGKKLTLVESIIARLKGGNKEGGQYLTIAPSNIDTTSGQKMEQVQSNNDHNKDIIKEINLKKQSNKHFEDNVACSFKKNNEEEEQIISLLTSATYNNVNVNFNESVAESLVKKYPMLGGRKLVDVVKEKIEYLKYETIDLSKYKPSSVLYNFIKEDREAPHAYKDYLNREKKQVESQKWLPILSVINETFNTITADNGRQLIRQKFANLIDSDSNSDKKKLSNSVIKMVEISNLSLSELTGFGDKRLTQIKEIVADKIGSGEVKCDPNVLKLLELGDQSVNSDTKQSDKVDDKAVKTVSTQPTLMENLTDAMAGLVKNFTMQSPAPSMAMV